MNEKIPEIAVISRTNKIFDEIKGKENRHVGLFSPDIIRKWPKDLRPEVVILDVPRFVVSLKDTIEGMRKTVGDTSLPFIVVGIEEDADNPSPIHDGDVLYLPADYKGVHLESSIRFICKMRRLIRINRGLKLDVELLQRANQKDTLTGLYNHGSIKELLSQEVNRAIRYKRPLSCILLDVDRFKGVNDTFGHQFGDQVLREIAAIIRGTVRSVDVTARYGGDEFLIVLPETDLNGARNTAEKIRILIEAYPFIEGKSSLKSITASLGVASYPEIGIKNWEELISHADQAMYRAKIEGRDRVCVFKERRRHPRWPVDLDVKCRIRRDDAWHVSRLANISRDGINIVVNTPIEPANYIALNMGLSEVEEVQLSGNVIWCRPVRFSNGSYSVGVKFMDLDPGVNMKIMEWSKAHG